LITGSNSRDVISAEAGVDTVDALEGSDEVGPGGGGTPFDMEFAEGGAGNDELRGGPGNDELADVQPSDIDDTDRLFGARHDDALFAEDGDGNDILDGGPGADDCYGDPGDEYIKCNNAVD
jgi:serralysin